MAEYVCKLPVDGMVSFMSGNTTIPVREEVVRCRDCKYCMSYWQSDYCDYFSHVTNDPDGFCSWGTPREDA